MDYKEVRLAEIKEPRVENISKLIKDGVLIQTSIAARKFNVDTRTVLRWIETGKIRALKIAGRWYVFRDELKKLIMGIEIE